MQLLQAPRLKYENFLINLNQVLNSLSLRNTSTFVFSDTNINLLKLTNNIPATEYLETVHSNGFLQLICKATRIAGNSYSLIDHVLCNRFKSDYVTGTILLDISDHFMNFLSIPLSSSKNDSKSKEKLTRDFSIANMTNFKNDLSALSWNDVTSVNDVDACFDVFWENFSTLYDLHFPLTKFTFNKNKHSKIEFMTPGLLISRTQKIELFKKSIVDPTNYLNRYRQYHNVFNSLVRASKKIHYDVKFAQHAKNPKKIWSLLNEITGNKINKSNTNIPNIVADGNIINSPSAIANEFNSFFVKAGQQISDSVPHTNKTPESFFSPTDDPPPLILTLVTLMLITYLTS